MKNQSVGFKLMLLRHDGKMVYKMQWVLLGS